MNISTQLIKELREKTGAGIADVKKALLESGGDIEKAMRLIEQRLGVIAGKKAARTAGVGMIDAYIHSNNRIGALVELFCETDFVAHSPPFKELAHAIALHVAAMRPLYLAIDAIPPEVWEAETRRIEEEVRKLAKPSHVQEEIIKGKLHAFFAPLTLLEQPFVKDQDKTVQEVLNEAIGRFGENIKLGRFVRFEV